eukprot:6190263-Pleurochrysis_carterae.AAC.4
MAMPASVEGHDFFSPTHRSPERGGFYAMDSRARAEWTEVVGGDISSRAGVLGGLHRVHPLSRPGGAIARQPQSDQLRAQLRLAAHL